MVSTIGIRYPFIAKRATLTLKPTIHPSISTFASRHVVPQIGFGEYRMRISPSMLTAAACAGAAGIAWYSRRYSKMVGDRASCGTLHPRLEPIRSIFEDILKNEKEGLAMAIYCDGELLADLYGGYADRKSSRHWTSDTMAVVFSTTKVLGSLIIAILVSRDHLGYEELVRKYWPAFARNGKENITVQSIMEHKAGLIKFADEFDIEKAGDPEFIAALIEKTEPMWPPGTTVGYHATAFGWLVDQLVRRSDPNKRSVGQFYREEILPHMSDKDFYVGLPPELNERVASVVNAKEYESFKEFIFMSLHKLHHLFRRLLRRQNLRDIACGYPKWMDVDDEVALNRAEVHAVENVAALGIGTARALASIPDAVMRKNLIRADIWKKLSKPTDLKPVKDIVIDRRALRGHGFFYYYHPTRKNSFLIGHGGHGGQMIVFDPQTKIVISIIRNGMRNSVLAQNDSDRIIEKTFHLLDNQ